MVASDIGMTAPRWVASPVGGYVGGMRRENGLPDRVVTGGQAARSAPSER